MIGSMCVDDLLLMNVRIVISERLKPEILTVCQSFRIQKTKARARTVVYQIMMNQYITDMISRCHTCIDVRNRFLKELLKPTPIPEGPWQMLGSDVFTLNNEDDFIVLDYYSTFFKQSSLRTPVNVCTLQHSLFTKSVYFKGIQRFKALPL